MNSMKKWALASWERLMSLVRTQARQAYSRDLNLAERITNVQVYMFPKIWYTAQVLQPPSECLRQMVSAVTWYIWQGAIFRVPISTLHRRKEDGGWGLADVNNKCRALLITWIWHQGQSEGIMTAGWLLYWNLHGKRDIPPCKAASPDPRIPAHIHPGNGVPRKPQAGRIPRTFRGRVY
jgi:hypothetical protein